VQEQDIKAQALTAKYILENFNKITLNIYSMNKTTGDESNVTASVIQSPGGNVGGVDTVKVTFVFKGEDEANITIWASKDYSTIVRIDMNGQTVEGALANMYGQQLLSQANSLLLPLTYVVGNIEFKIAGDTIMAAKHGWQVTKAAPTTNEISGHTYNAYEIAFKNVGDASTTADNIEATITEIVPNAWVVTHLIVNWGDGSVLTLQVTELIPK